MLPGRQSLNLVIIPEFQANLIHYTRPSGHILIPLYQVIRQEVNHEAVSPHSLYMYQVYQASSYPLYLVIRQTLIHYTRLSGKPLSNIPGYQASSYPLYMYQVIRKALIQYTRLSGKLLSIIQVPGYQEGPYPIYQVIRQTFIYDTRLSGKPSLHHTTCQASPCPLYQLSGKPLLLGKPLAIIPGYPANPYT